MQQAVCWTITTGEAGMGSQANGLAEAIGLPYTPKIARPGRPWSWLPGHLCPGVLGGLTTDSVPLIPPWPELLISCGRRSTALSIAIRQKSRGRTLTVHIQDPRIPARYFDMVVPMAHDPIRGANVYPTSTALHPITQEKLAQAGRHFAPLFAALPRPLVAVLVGGKSRSHPFDAAECKALVAQLRTLQSRDGAGLIITTSRRTGEENTRLIREGLAGKQALIWSGTGENPYLGMLALADYILASEDSVSMVSEAIASGHPVYTLSLKGHSKRLAAFHQGLRTAGMTRPFQGHIENGRDAFTGSKTHETDRIAAIIRTRLSERGLTPFNH